ncbi:hypothetical protein FALCPG4_001199 [Fusarium falciforme]
MEILVDWESEDKKFTGSTRSLYFSVSNKSQPDTTLQEKIAASASSEVSLETTTAATATSSASATDSASDSSGGGGLSTGAKAGIAVGAVIGGLLIIGALAFFLLRRRRRSKQLGEDYTSQQAYTVDKETHGRATDSPNSPYSDENQVQPVALQNISHDHEEQTARGTPTPNNLPRTSTGSRNAPTPPGHVIQCGSPGRGWHDGRGDSEAGGRGTRAGRRDRACCKTVVPLRFASPGQGRLLPVDQRSRRASCLRASLGLEFWIVTFIILFTIACRVGHSCTLLDSFVVAVALPHVPRPLG